MCCAARFVIEDNQYRIVFLNKSTASKPLKPVHLGKQTNKQTNNKKENLVFYHEPFFIEQRL